MASVLCQRLLTTLVKMRKILYSSDHTIFTSMLSYQIMYGETLDFSINNGNIKYSIGKSIFAVNLSLKLFRVTIANADIGSLKSLHTFL